MLNICLVNSQPLKQTNRFSSVRNYNLDMDNEASVIFDICDMFEETGNIRFIITGFGQEEWPVSCRFDLPGLIEELPEIVSKINLGDYNFTLNFDEQGIEREIIFEENEVNVSVTCISRTTWKPTPSTIRMEKGDVRRVFTRLHENFVSYSTLLCFDLINNPLLKDWLSINKKVK